VNRITPTEKRVIEGPNGTRFYILGMRFIKVPKAVESTVPYIKMSIAKHYPLVNIVRNLVRLCLYELII
jgi:hypothetical protein